MFGNPMEIAMLVGAAVLLFGADKLPKLARGMGQAKKEFLVGQAEADIEAERVRAEARTSAERRTTTGRFGEVETITGQNAVEPTPPSAPTHPSTGTTTQV